MGLDHLCLHEERWGRVLTQLEVVVNKVCKHVDEGEREGGHRDMLKGAVQDIIYLKKQVSEIKKGYWKSGAIGGAIVGMMIKSPDIASLVTSLITKLVFAGQ